MQRGAFLLWNPRFNHIAKFEETRANLQEAITLVLDANRQLADEEIRGEEVLKETIAVWTS